MKEIFLYDVHTHTNMEPMINELDNIVNICKDKKIIWNCVGTTIEDSKIAIDQARKYPGQIYATIGIHPDNCKDESDVQKLENLYLENKDVVVAIGEIGLDYHNMVCDKETQIKFFKKLVELANKYDLPICIHVRDAEDDCLEVLKMVKNPQRVWIHCFAKNVEIAKKYVDRGYMISIPGIITFKNAKDLHESIKKIPLNKLMIETDGPWLAPEPNRGKINYPHYVEYTMKCIAKMLNLSEQQLSKTLTNNSLRFFNN